MIVQTEFLNDLKDFGLNSYESKLWVALLSRGVSTAGELSDIANVPRSRSYDVLESLEKKGFIMVKIGKPIKYIAVPPEDVIERVKKRIMVEAETHAKIVSELEKSGTVEDLNLLYKQGIEMVDPAELSGSLKGRKNIYNHLESTIKKAKKTVSIKTTNAGLLRKAEFLQTVIKKAKERGVKVKIAAPITKELQEAVNDLSEFAEIRNSNAKGRFCVVDGEEIIFMVMDDKEVHPTYDVGVWVRTPFFASALEQLFDQSWKNMTSAKEKIKEA